MSDKAWPIGEAKDCTVDSKWKEAHCFPPTPEAVAAEKHDYLVSVRFEKPLVFDKEGWAYNVYADSNPPSTLRAFSNPPSSHCCMCERNAKNWRRFVL